MSVIHTKETQKDLFKRISKMVDNGSTITHLSKNSKTGGYELHYSDKHEEPNQSMSNSVKKKFTELDGKIEVLEQTVKIYESVMEQLNDEITSEKTVQIYRKILDKDRKIYGPITTRIIDKKLEK